MFNTYLIEAQIELNLLCSDSDDENVNLIAGFLSIVLI